MKEGRILKDTRDCERWKKREREGEKWRLKWREESEKQRERVKTFPHRLFVYASLGCHFSFQYFILSKMLWEY